MPPLIPGVLALAKVIGSLVEPAGRAVAVDELRPRGVDPVSPATRAAEHDLLVDLDLGEGMGQERQREPMVPPQEL